MAELLLKGVPVRRNISQSWLNGQQKHSHMPRAVHSARSISHLAKLLVLAEAAGVLPDPVLACHRMRLLPELAGAE